MFGYDHREFGTGQSIYRKRTQQHGERTDEPDVGVAWAGGSPVHGNDELAAAGGNLLKVVPFEIGYKIKIPKENITFFQPLHCPLPY
jgi:hypothetical protein